MTNKKAINILAVAVEAAKGRCFVTDEAISDAYDMAIKALEAQDVPDLNVGDTISRREAIDAVDSETVSTNPEHFKSSEKFIKFMDDADIASFGKWQWANGFNTALVATEIQLKKLTAAQSEIIHCRDCRYSIDFYQDGCCYCKMPSKEMRYIEEGWDFYCAAGKEKNDERDNT